MSDAPTTYPTVCPYLVVPDADPVMGFLKAAFGAQEIEVQRDAERIVHAEVRLGDSVVMLGSKAPGRPASLYLTVEDVDAAYARALEVGGGSEGPPQNHPYGRTAGVTDPGGNIWWLAGPVHD